MKLMIKLSIALAVLCIALITLLLIFIDPNDYKAEIEAQVKQSIQRDLHIKGDLDWAFYPQLGFNSGEIELDNLQSFNKPHLIKIDQASIGINISSLLKGQLSLAKLTIDGFQLTLLTDENGVSNLDNMGNEDTSASQDVTAPTEETDSTSEPSEVAFLDISKTQLDGIEIKNAVIEMQDLQNDSYQKITVNEITLGQFELNKDTDFSLNTTITIDDIQAQIALTTQLRVNNALDSIELKDLLLSTQLTADALPNGELTSTLKSHITYAVNSQKITIDGLDINTQVSADNLPNQKVSTQLNANTIEVNGAQTVISQLNLLIDNSLQLGGEISVETGAITKVRYELIANQWDLTPYMSEDDTADNAQQDNASSTTEPTPEVEPDLSFLNDLDIDGTLKIAGIMINELTIGEINKHLIISQGKAQLSPLTAELYEGLLTVNGSVDESQGRNKYQVVSALNNVQLMPLLTDAAQVTLISGESNVNFTGSGEGLTSTKIQQGLVGSGDFSILDGELYGININQEIRSIKATLKGEEAPTNDAIKKTDFASLIGNFSIDKGLVNNQKLLMTSPVIRLDGAGLIETINQSLDYKLSISPLSKTTAETDYSDLNGVTIPLVITGSFSDPSFSIDTESVLKEQLQAELDAQKEKLKEKAEKALTEKLGSKIDTEGLSDKLKSLF